MNLYIRYFDEEVLVPTVKEVFEFLQSIPEIEIDDYLIDDIVKYVESSNNYPKRYKVHGRAYFIIIKTNAATMEEFKANGASGNDTQRTERPVSKGQAEVYGEYNPGWYQGSVFFKRVIQIPQTQKFQYKDTRFVARVKATSVQDCYNKIIDHLRSRSDVDTRSQFPSIKGHKFECQYLGMNPEA